MCARTHVRGGGGSIFDLPGSIFDFEPGSIFYFEPGSIFDSEPGSIFYFEPGVLENRDFALVLAICSGLKYIKTVCLPLSK